MFELLKIFVENVFKLINIKDIVDARKSTRLSDVGADLFSLYGSLNRIYIFGNQISDEIDGIIQSAEVRQNSGNKSETFDISRLRKLINQQGMNISEFRDAFERLFQTIGVVDKTTARAIQLFIDRKASIIDLLIRLTDSNRSAVAMFRADFEDSIVYLIDEGRKLHFDDAKFNPTDTLLQLQNSIFALQQPNPNIIVFRQIEELKRYVQARKPKDSMQVLAEILEKFYDSLIKNFKIEDVLLKVGEYRLQPSRV